MKMMLKGTVLLIIWLTDGLKSVDRNRYGIRLDQGKQLATAIRWVTAVVFLTQLY